MKVFEKNNKENKHHNQFYAQAKTMKVSTSWKTSQDVSAHFTNLFRIVWFQLQGFFDNQFWYW